MRGGGPWARGREFSPVNQEALLGLLGDVGFGGLENKTFHLFSQGMEFCLRSLQMRWALLPFAGSCMHARCDGYPNSLHREAGW